MALSNKERVGRILDTLRDGLLPFILREYRFTFKGDALREIDAALSTNTSDGLPPAAYTDEASLTRTLDTHACLHLMWRRWNDVFQDKLGHAGRSYVSELLQARNDWAHIGAAPSGGFDNDQAYRIADTAARLLKMISAGDEAARVEEISRDLLRLRFEAEADRARKESVTQTAATTTLAGLRPWRAVVQPHPDVASGRYMQAEFAADLSQVLAGTAEREYQDPLEFFRRTYLTEGLLALLVTGVKRLTAQGGDPVVQLQTSFGGGKTHSMLALYHLTRGKLRLPDVPGGERLAAQIGQVDLPEANIAVLVGTALDPTKPRQYPDATVHTLWGEMAYQIGGRKAYDLLAQADQTGVSPGSNTLHDLLFQFGPCLIIVDELVAYARNLYGAGRLPSGTFDSVMTFIQALTEAVRRSQESMMLISIPESNIEIGGEAGKKTLDTLAHIVGRMEAVWKPVTATESFEIVRRRLFASEVDYAARDTVVSAFGDMYRNAPGEFPSGVAERDYLERMRSAYPIHPEMFDRLYEDWSTLEKFQRTRGVLRLMAAVIHQLWSRGDQSLCILPGTLPLDASPVRNEILRYLPDTWAGVFDSEIDGPHADPLQLDGQIPALGRYSANRRVARTIFIGSAPSVAGQRVRGLEEIRIRLGCAQPGEPTAVFGDALRRMSNQMAYLYTDGSRYWYDTHPTVTKLARDRAQGFSLPEVDAEIIERLRKVGKNRDFASHHVAPLDTSDVADEDRARIVVLRPEHAHKRSNGGTPAQLAVRRFLESRGTAQRLYKNMLVFIAPDVDDVESLRQAVRETLAWKSIKDDEESLNLDAQQRRQVKTSLDKADETTNLRLRAAYNWLLTPTQPDPLGAIELQASRISGDDSFYDRAARKLRNDGLLIYEWSPDILLMELDKYIWNSERGWEVRLQQLWEYLAQYCYLPRLFDQNVLIQAVKRGVERLDAPFAYATGKHPDGHHTGLVFRQLGQVYSDAQSLLIHPAHIIHPPESKPVITPTPVIEGGVQPPVSPGGEILPPPISPPPLPVRKALTRYHGHVTIDPKRAQRETALIIEEVVQRLTSLLGTDVEITLEISARKPDGFDESTVRTISENSRTLKFEGFGFEEG
jgi:predicted AAA+ superfamily ATPase